MRVIRGRQNNKGARFWCEFGADILIKDMVLVNKSTPESRLIKEFSNNRNYTDCTLTTFIRWLQQKKGKGGCV